MICLCGGTIHIYFTTVDDEEGIKLELRLYCRLCNRPALSTAARDQLQDSLNELVS